MRALLVVLLASGCDAVFEIDPPGTESVRSRAITVTGPPNAQLASFPVSIVLVGDEDLAAYARDDGTDLHFRLADQGGDLPFEIVDFHRAEGRLEAWVGVDLSGDGSTKIRLLYGGAPWDQPSTRSAVWNSSHFAAWHLDIRAGGLRDSTSPGRDFQFEAGPTSPGAVTGAVGSGLAFAAGTAPVCTANTPLDLARNSFSFGAWLKRGTTDGAWDQPLFGGSVNQDTGGFAFELTPSGELLHVLLTDSAIPSRRHVDLAMSAPPMNQWTHVVSVVDRTREQVTTYFNGFMVDQQALTGFDAIEVTEPFCFGRPDGYVGEIDEVRVYRGALAPSWIRAEYDNQRNRDEFIHIASPPIRR